MGLALGFSDKVVSPKAPMPNPKRFEVLERLGEQHGKVLLKVYYPDCTTFEGTKILLIRGLVGKELDPHFLEDNNVLARFRPDSEGMTLARQCLYSSIGRAAGS